MPPLQGRKYNRKAALAQTSAMTKSPVKKLDQTSYVKTNVRLPPELHSQLVDEGKRHGRSMNAEIIARLQDDSTAAVMAELAEVKTMLRKLLDRT